MKEPNTAAITASLERSLRNCSLNHENGVEDDGNVDIKVSNGAVFNNSGISLPYFWEQQCLDLKAEDVYYKNYRDGVESTEDPRRAAVAAEYGGDFSSDDDDGDSWYDSEDYSSSGSSPSEDNNNNHRAVLEEENGNVLVVAGCKSCYMYFMVPKKAEACPKCNGHLLRFDRSLISSP
ncbi:hypothetical protein like AT2G33510 [Hibiscus trionum]|uniref:Uncharacterized protein n=1 Tax=Hibiscus trionum TaxID=183268 RepID=A0A9W7J2J8_HIBTR|nr:hypothetical protein like AT2G33510 [Hibiscus trionum]